MKQLSRNEIVELVSSPLLLHIEDEKQAERLAKVILNNLQRAGVLMLVDIEDYQEGDLAINGGMKLGTIRLPAKDNNFTDTMVHSLWTGEMNKARGAAIIQRNNTPVYQCKKEVTND